MPAPIQPLGAVLSPSINVYRVVPAQFIADQKDEIAKRVFGAKAAVDGSRVLRVSELTGSLRFADSERLWNNANLSTLPKTGEEARKIAKKFLNAARKNLASAKEPVGSNLRHLFPDFPEKAEDVQCSYAFDWDKNTPDHWLVRFAGQLSTGIVVPTPVGVIAPARRILASIDPNILPIGSGNVEERLPEAGEVKIPASQEAGAVPVHGGIVDIRIGADGKIVGLLSRWLPHLEPIMAPRLPPPKPRNESQGAEPFLLYRIGGDNEPQEYIAPYYLIPNSEGDTGEIMPASTYSLLVRIAQQGDSNLVHLTAVVAGTQNAIRYAWGCWRLFGAKGYEFLPLGTSSSVDLDQPSTYNVVVDVEDTVTKAFARSQTMVYWPLSETTTQE